jgi:DNA repair protein RecO (recombination protein O)
MLLKTKGIVFRTLRYGETSVIADIFTEEKGLHSFIGGSVRTAKSRMPFPLFQPMSVVDLVSYYRDDVTALNRLKELRAAEVWQRIPFEVPKGAIVLFMAEVCRKSIHEAEENRELFSFLLDYLRFLDATEQPIANLHLHFLVGLSGFLGFLPPLESLEAGVNYFDYKEGLFTATQPLHGQSMDVTQSRALVSLLEAPLEDCASVSFSKPERKAMLQKLLDFYRLHVPNFGEVNTVEVLETVFA